MRALRFGMGGVAPLRRQHEGKALTQDKPIVTLALKGNVSIPLMQNIGSPCRAIVKAGQRVCVGEKIAEPTGYVGAPVHASVSGKVLAVRDMLHVTGLRLPHIEIENDNLYEIKSDLRAYSFADAMELPPGELQKIVQEAGVVGAGGATFPTHVKLNVPADKKIDTLLINGAECEPFITADYRLMLEYGSQIVDGAAIAMHILGVEKGIIGIEDNKPMAIEAMKKAAQTHPGISVAVLMTKYPQGSEKHLIEAILHRRVPSGMLPMDVGCVVCNVGTCAAISDAVLLGMPMISRVTTVSGSVLNPQNLRIRIGCSFAEAIEACGGYVGEPTKLISGGPMMGVTQSEDSVCVVKGTSGILVLNAKSTAYPKELNCIRCAKCVYVCPVGLVPTSIDLWSRNKDWERAEDYLAANCIECGCCAYICPSKRHLVQSIRLAKGEITKRQRERASKAQGGTKP